jgi:hypothetical protein
MGFGAPVGAGAKRKAKPFVMARRPPQSRKGLGLGHVGDKPLHGRHEFLGQEQGATATGRTRAPAWFQ